MSAIITLSERITSAKKYIDRNFNPLIEGRYAYFYTGRTTPWNNEYSPDLSTSSEKELFNHRFRRIFLKQLTRDNVTLAIKRFNWAKNTKYSRADYNVDYTDYRFWINPESPFYVMNSEGNVYKCISNNYGGDSLEEPTGQSLGYINLGDGYIWKFMYDLTDTIKDTFLTKTWLPLPYEDSKKSFAHLLVQSAAIVGDIYYIHVDNPGTGFTAPPTIQIRGDGVGATAVAIMDGQRISRIELSDPGSGYTHAEVKIYGNGVGASATAMIAPPGGHGFNAVMELGAFYIEISKEIISSEDGFIPTTGTYRNIGVVLDTRDKLGEIITDERFNTLSTINIVNASGNFLPDEIIIGETSRAQGTVYYDPGGVDKTLTMYMIEGTFIDGEVLHGQKTGEVADYVELDSTYTNVDIWSGEILYKENIIFITRRDIQIEKFVFTIEF